MTVTKQDRLLDIFKEPGTVVSIPYVLSESGVSTLASLRTFLCKIRRETGLSIRIKRGAVVRDK